MYVYWFIHAFCVLFNDVAWGDKLWLIFPLYPWRDKLWLLLPTWFYCESIGGGIYCYIVYIHPLYRWPPLNLYVSCFLGVSSRCLLTNRPTLFINHQLELVASIHIYCLFFAWIGLHSVLHTIGEHKPRNKNQGRSRNSVTTIQNP